MHLLTNRFFCISIFITLGLSLTFVKSKAQDKRPNILFCIADDASLEHFGAYGSTWVKTPAFDRVAKEGILFKNAYTPNAKCAPSRASILMGRNSWQLEEIGNHLAYWPAKYISVMELLAKNNYITGYTGKGWAPGLPPEVNGKPRQLNGKPYQEMKISPPTTGISPVDYAGNFDNFLEDADKGKPFFFWFGGFEPHRNYEYGSGKRLGGKDASAIDNVHDFWPDTDSVRNDLMDYAYEVEYFDKTLEKMINLLEAKGMLNNTIIVVTSDNGMAFPRIKGQEYEMSNHLPLAIMWKNGIKNPGRSVEDFVSFIDFAPTFMQVSATNSDAAKNNKPQGRSLTDIFNSEKAGQVTSYRDHVLLGQERHDVGRPNEAGYPIRSIVKGDFLYIHNFEPNRWPSANPETGYLNTDGSPTKTAILNANRKIPGQDKNWQLGFGKRGAEELYNVKKDPQCLNNLISDAVFVSIARELQTQMVKELKQQGDPRMFGKGYLFDNYPPIEGKDFYQKFLNGEKQKTEWVNPTDYETDPRVIKENQSHHK